MQSLSLSFHHVVPVPLADFPTEGEVWRTDLEMEFPSRILLNASSGKGKTTFSSIVYGLRRDYTGSVSFDGDNINEFNLHRWIELRRTRISAIFQDLQIFPKLTAWENLKLKNSLTSHRSDDEIEAMLDRLALLGRKNQLCGTLSLGQQQRIAIIRSLLQPFELLVMDEPFSHLDESNAFAALSLINDETTRNGGGYILTTLGSRHGGKFDRIIQL